MGAVQNQVSVTRRPPDVEDYIDMMRRYRSWIIGPMFLGVVAATVIAFLWPDTYVSSAVMRITPQQVPDKLIPSVVQGQMAERLQQMQVEILSRNSLAEIIQKPSFNLYKKERAKLPIEDIVQDMRNKYIRISAIMDVSASGRRGGASSFQISFAYTDRYLAQAVVRELVAKFTEQNVTVQKNQATATTNFLDDTKKQAKDKMDALEGQLVKFKMENQGRLPEQATANVSQMSTIQMQIMNLNGQLSGVQQDKMLLETALKNQRGREKLEESRLEETVTIAGSPGAAVRNENLINLNSKISQARSDLAVRKQMLGAKHPDVATAQAVIDDLERQRDAALERVEAAPAPTAPVVRTVINAEARKTLEELKREVATTESQITAKQLKIEEINRNIDQFQKQLLAYQKRLDDAPLSEQQYAALLRELNLAKAEYEEMSKRRDTAETAKDLEEHKAGENLETLDPPFLPEKPTEPNRPLWSAAGLFGGLVAGFILAAAKEMKDASLKNLKDVRAYTNLPVLSSIPLLENALLVRRKRRLVWLAWTSALVMGFLLMGGAMYYRYTV